MRDLRVSLLQHDVTLLRVIAEKWAVDVAGLSARQAADKLCKAMLSTDWPAELSDLPAGEQATIRSLLAAAGRLQVDTFFRRFGSIRPFGPGSLARERPWEQPSGPAEALWYRGWIFRAFEQTELGGQEFVYLAEEVQATLPAPDDMRPSLQPIPAEGGVIPQHQGATGQPPQVTELVDDCCTLLAYTQSHFVPVGPQADLPTGELLPFLCYKERARLEMIWALAHDANLLQVENEAFRPHAQIARQWLQTSYPEQAAVLAQTWLEGDRWNDLMHVPSLQPEGAGWQNDPRPPRHLLLDMLAHLEPDTWWQLESFASVVKAACPDFQRTAGDYDSWYLRDVDTKEYVMGFEHWDQVEGALLRFLVSGPLLWLGLVELGREEPAGAMVFRPTVAGRTFAQVKSFPYPPGPAQARIRVFADATILVPTGTDRFTRFQVARLADWEPRTADYRYRLTPNSLARARRAGIPLARALAFLASRSGQPLPGPVTDAVEAWEQDGVVIRLRPVDLLQVKDEAVLERLRAAPQVRSMLGEAIGPLAVAVRATDLDRLTSAIAELGLLSEVETK